MRILLNVGCINLSYHGLIGVHIAL